MTNSPSVSVALAAHNGERYIKEQIESILSQLQEADELVVSDDGSIDSTIEIVRAVANTDPRVKVVLSDKSGIVANFNNAIANCSGEYIFISDQDDIWVPGKRAAVLQIFAEHDVDLVIHDGCHVDRSNTIVSDSFFNMWHIGPGIIRNYLMPRYSGCCMALRRRALTYVMPMPEAVINYDHWIGVACEAFGSIYFLPSVFLRHRVHGENATTSRRPIAVIARERLSLLRELIDRRCQVARMR